MRERFMRGMVLLLLVGVAGCASQDAQDQVLQDLRSVQSERDRLHAQNEALNKQLLALKDVNAKLKDEVDKANAQIASSNAANEAAAKEHKAVETKMKDLERQVKDSTAAKKAAVQELEVAKQRYEDSLRIQKRQAKELKERGQSALLQPPVPGGETPQPTPAPSTSASSPAPAQDQGAIMPPTAPKAVLVDINKATPAELSLTLELPKEDSDRLVKNRPYKTKDELVTKAGIAKATVDKIKDKITVGP